jgi:hypothetical protein
MMIHVPIAPNQPVTPAHFAEERMRGERRPIGKRMDQRAQLRAVAFPIGWRRSAAALLDFRPGWRPMRPRNGSVQREPFDKSLLDQIGFRARVSFPSANVERIIQMADHLGGGHASPLPTGRWIQPGDSIAATVPSIRVGQSAHASGCLFSASKWRMSREARSNRCRLAALASRRAWNNRRRRRGKSDAIDPARLR